MQTNFDLMPRFDPTKQIDAVMNRCSFLKSAAAATLLASATPQVLLAENRKEMPQRLLGRMGAKVSTIGLGGFHIGKQADEVQRITIKSAFRERLNASKRETTD
jgi:hypothetical protein